MSDFAWAIKNGDVELVKKLVEGDGVDVNATVEGRTPLHYAGDYGQLPVLQYLTSRGAALNTPDKHGISPLLAAIWEGHTECVKFLLEKGADKNGTAPDGTSYAEAAEKQEIKALLAWNDDVGRNDETTIYVWRWMIIDHAIMINKILYCSSVYFFYLTDFLSCLAAKVQNLWDAFLILLMIFW